MDNGKRKVAYHEGGHALVAQLLPHTDPVHKVSIIPTAKGALGYTMQMPEEDQYLLGQEGLEERMAVMPGGRSAELLVFGEPSIGAANDLERATELAQGPLKSHPPASERRAAYRVSGTAGRPWPPRPPLSPEGGGRRGS